jgi:hypothetical protein
MAAVVATVATWLQFGADLRATRTIATATAKPSINHLSAATSKTPKADPAFIV